MMKPITEEEAKRYQVRAESAWRKMNRAAGRGDRERANLWARVWARAVDKIGDYKRQQRDLEEAAIAASYQVGHRVIWRGSVHTVVEVGSRFEEPWLRLDTDPITGRWVPARLVKAQL